MKSQKKYTDLYLNLQGLRVQGKSYKEIEKLTGLKKSTLWNFVNGKTKSIRKASEKKANARIKYLSKSKKQYKNTIAKKNKYLVEVLSKKRSKYDIKRTVKKLSKDKKGLDTLVKREAKKTKKGKKNLEVAILEQWSELWKGQKHTKANYNKQPRKKKLTKKELQLLKQFGRSK